MRSAAPNADRVLVVMSDIEMGAGGPTDDFPRSERLAELLRSFNRPPYDEVPLDVVFNGDTFDFLKTPVGGDYPRHITAEVARAKLDIVAAAHPDFFAALAELVGFEGPPRRIRFIVGNHDAELLFADVQAEIRRRCGSSDAVTFPGFEFEDGPVHIEHGSQEDRMFRMDPDRPFVDSDEGRILNLPWGSVALLEVVIPLHPVLHLLDRVRPRGKLFEVMPEARELLLGRYWRYWTRDYVKGLFQRREPLHHLTWSMVKEIVYRFVSVDADVSVAGRFRRRLLGSEGPRLFVVGHRHEVSWYSHGARRLVQTGCLRDEFALADNGDLRDLLPKSYLEIYLAGDELAGTALREVVWPTPEPEAKSVLELLPVVRRLLGPAEERARVARDRESHEAAEDADDRG